MDHKKSQRIFKQSQKLMPGGVNSPVRSFAAVGGGPVVIARGTGSHIWDVDGNEYVDYVGSWGPLILGHAMPQVVRAVSETARNGLSYGAPTRQELAMAEMITSPMPSMEMVRMVSSGTEAVMSAIRAARAYTGKDKIIKFEGCYHGHSDGMLVKAGSGVLTFGVADSAGIPEGYAKNTLTAQYNDLNGVEALFKANKGQIAAIIVEPVAANMGVVLPKAGFLDGLRRIASRERALLIFDEVITGFRLAYGGAQSVYKVTPDLTCLGKIIGGGMPVGAYGGRQDVMGVISPVGPAYQAGTLSGNPVAIAAGIATLKALKPSIYKKIDSLAAELEDGLSSAAKRVGTPVTINRAGSILTMFFTSRQVVDYPSAKKSDLKAFGRYFRDMLEAGIYLPPSQFEAMFVSASHTQSDIKKTIDAASAAFKRTFASKMDS
ncbi:MAG: glutamate-1-semialdehyde-2,1-aminomutase [Dehalococcoidia bacterium]|nr:glutamate-1-semialdehyde-2,1-aminomutase [Dehalococcoidia bacterium]